MDEDEDRFRPPFGKATRLAPRPASPVAGVNDAWPAQRRRGSRNCAERSIVYCLRLYSVGHLVHRPESLEFLE